MGKKNLIPFGICREHCKWFFGEDRSNNCRSICPSASYLLNPNLTTEGVDHIEPVPLSELPHGSYHVVYGRDLRRSVFYMKPEKGKAQRIDSDIG